MRLGGCSVVAASHEKADAEATLAAKLGLTPPPSGRAMTVDKTDQETAVIG